jgi:multiple sugar transport system substrate-binding protein
MKKFVYCLLITVFALSLVGCAPQAAPTAAALATAVPVAPATAVPVVQDNATAAPPAPLGPTTIKVSGWTYDTASWQANIAKYETWVSTEADPQINVKVDWTDADFDSYDTFITTLFQGGDSRDVIVSSDQWLGKLADAGWVVPLEDSWPEVRNYASDMTKHSLESLTYNGKIYGLPYYSDIMVFVYNKTMLDKAGITAPPTTWAEVTEDSKILMEKGITTMPLELGLMPGSWFDDTVYAMVYSEGGQLFDAENKPVFETTQGPVFDMVEWLAKSISVDKIIPQKCLTLEPSDIQQAFKNGETAFVIVPDYMMKEFNTPGISKIAGSAYLSMMPGATHQTDGFTRMYLLGNDAITDPVKLKASIDLINFWGGKTTYNGVEGYNISKQWAVNNGLGFSMKSLWSNPEVLQTVSAMTNVNVLKKQQDLALSKQGMQAPWFAEWMSFTRSELSKALLKEQTTDVALENIKQQWLSLSSQ